MFLHAVVRDILVRRNGHANAPEALEGWRKLSSNPGPDPKEHAQMKIGMGLP